MPAGRPKGQPRTGGRKPGTLNKATREIRELALMYAPAAIREAGRLVTKAKTEATRLGAINTILDRAYGKPPQAIQHSGAVGAYDAEKLSELTDDDLARLKELRARLVLAGGRPSDQRGDSET